ncbi:hypothetical protein [Pannonibacter sp. SL95]|uniref:hypothetical protein n=1 Tax=Pannonibacter sp. SL95 TaxID=2995153 RepID=UPI002272E6EA|nr:hypothetical protein [Pannonibacter sp. SL95]MCY1707013.1 hypothetical protein [Pannonibacter sp. SL95]
MADERTLERRVFAFWTGSNPMSEDRARCLASLSATGAQVILVTPDTLSDWLVPGAPLHPAYDRLSAVHRSDYLRPYFMHHHGGGYADIKFTRESWLPAFDRLEGSDAFGIGYREGSPKGVAHIHRHRLGGDLYIGTRRAGSLANLMRYRYLRLNYKRLIGMCAYIFKPGTEFTQAWLDTVNARLDLAAADLARNPASTPRQANDSQGPDVTTAYPLPWSFICADVLHPLAHRHRDRILRELPPPSFKDYL